MAFIQTVIFLAFIGGVGSYVAGELTKFNDEIRREMNVYHFKSKRKKTMVA